MNNARFRTTKLMVYKIMALNSSISYMLMRLVTFGYEKQEPILKNIVFNKRLPSCQLAVQR